MSTGKDWSKYKITSEPVQEKSRWDKYKVKDSTIEEPVKESEYSQVPYIAPMAREAISRFIGFPRALSDLADIPSDYLVKKLFGEDVSKRIEGSRVKPFLPSSEQVKGIIDIATKGGAKPVSTGEKLAAEGTGFLAESVFPLGVATKGAKLLPSVTQASSAFGAGVGSKLAEENELGLAGQLASTVAGAKAGSLATRGAKSAVNLVKNPVKELAENPLLRPKSTPNVRAVIQAAKDLDIPLPYSAITESSTQKAGEKILQTNPFSKETYKELFSKTNDAFVDNYKKVLDRISAKSFLSSTEAGYTSKADIKTSRDLHRKLHNDAYDKLEDYASKVKKTYSRTGLSTLSTKFISKLDKSLLASTEEIGVIDKFKKLKDNLENLKLKGENVTIEQLLATERSLNDILQYEVQGGSKKLLHHIKNQVTSKLDNYGKIDKTFGALHKRAKGLFAEHADTYRNDLIESILFGEKPELILSKMDSIGEIEKIRKSLSITKQGKETFDALKRFKLEEYIGKKVIDVGSGEVKYKSASTIFADPTKAPLIEELVGKQNYNQIKKLQKVSEGINKGFVEFANPSGTAHTTYAITAPMAALGSMFTGISTGSLPFVVAGVGQVVAPKVMSKLLTNDKFLKYASEASLAGNAKKKKAYIRAFTGMMHEFQNAVKEMEDVYEKESSSP